MDYMYLLKIALKTWSISTVWSTNLLSAICPLVAYGHNLHIDYLSVMIFNVLNRFVLQVVEMCCKVDHINVYP